MDFSFFLDCWLPTIYISIWQVLYLAVIILLAFAIGYLKDTFFTHQK